uniref:Uncharacterized protein n=1 Tax=Eutreptiella gymnastica TaxID=73025 RepID=A0A6T2K8Y5_9EUGL
MQSHRQCSTTQNTPGGMRAILHPAAPAVRACGTLRPTVGPQSTPSNPRIRHANFLRSPGYIRDNWGPKHTPPEGMLSYCTWAQDAASTKAQIELWLVSGLKGHR